MLKELGITNFAIIDRIVLAFHDGLNVISGETGAGKSILIGAIGLLLGGPRTYHECLTRETQQRRQGIMRWLSADTPAKP